MSLKNMNLMKNLPIFEANIMYRNVSVQWVMLGQKTQTSVITYKLRNSKMDEP